MSRKYIMWLNEFGKESLPIVGGKCASLGEMVRVGIPVPPGFAITTHAYDEFLSETGAGLEIREYLRKEFPEAPKTPKEVSEVSNAAQTIIESKNIPRKIRDSICEAYRRLCKETGTDRVAVRSSGVAEDMPGASFAGQYETFLNVRGEEELLKKVKSCWASMFSARSIPYRLHQGLPVIAGSMSVAVMKMVQAKSAGVAFSADPLTGDRTKVLINASWGVGEAVVQGLVTPDQFLVDKKQLKVVEKQICKKEKMCAMKEEGTVEEPVPEEKQNEPSVTDEEVLRIAELTIMAEAHYGSPQDVEWVIDANLSFPESIFLVQSRPITRLPEWKDPTERIIGYIIEETRLRRR